MILAPALPNAMLAPKYPGSSIHTGSRGFSRKRANRSSACCIPETITICSEVHRTPREARKYPAIASRKGRYPRPSASVFNHDLKWRARSAARRPRDLGREFSDGWISHSKWPDTRCKGQVDEGLWPYGFRNDTTHVSRRSRRHPPGWRGRRNTIHPRTQSNAAGYVAFRLQAFKHANHGSPRQPVLAGEVSGGRQPDARAKPAFQNGTSQLCVQPGGERLILRTAIESEFERADGFRHSFPLGPMIFAENGSVQCTNPARTISRVSGKSSRGTRG